METQYLDWDWVLAQEEYEIAKKAYDEKDSVYDDGETELIVDANHYIGGYYD